MIGVVDYGVGNLFSLSASLKYLGITSIVTGDRAVLHDCEKIILPGVGAFGDAAEKLRETGLFDFLLSEAENGKPLLGICLGMQLLFSSSEEYGVHEGLGIIEGKITSLEEKIDLKIPHIGWNRLIYKAPSPILKYVSDGEYVYYVHSFFADGKGDFCAAYSDYGTEIAGVVQKGKVFGTQFHPEKSGKTGLKILQAFAETEG